MKVKTKTNLIYAGNIYEANSEIEMDECTAAIAEKYGKIEILDGIVVENEEFEPAEGLPPLEPSKKKK